MFFNLQNSYKGKTLWRKEVSVHRAFWIFINSVKVCKDMTNTFYIWGYYHMITNHTIYVHRGTTSTVYFICKSRTNKTGSISRDTSSPLHFYLCIMVICIILNKMKFILHCSLLDRTMKQSETGINAEHLFRSWQLNVESWPVSSQKVAHHRNIVAYYVL